MRPDICRTSPESFRHPLRAEKNGYPTINGALPMASQEGPVEDVTALRGQNVVAIGNYSFSAISRDDGTSARSLSLLTSVETGSPPITIVQPKSKNARSSFRDRAARNSEGGPLNIKNRSTNRLLYSPQYMWSDKEYYLSPAYSLAGGLEETAQEGDASQDRNPTL